MMAKTIRMIQGTGLRIASDRSSDVQKPFPKHYYSQLNWPSSIARIGLRWSIKEDGSCRIERGYTKAFIQETPADITLPQTIDGRPVTEIAAFAFDIVANPPVSGIITTTHSSLTASLRIPNTVKKLGKYSIIGLEPETLYIPASVSHIDTIGAFIIEHGHEEIRRRVIVDPSNKQYKSHEGSLYTHNMEKLLYCAKPYSETLTLPKSVKYFGEEAFTYGSHYPLVIYSSDLLSQITITPNRHCLWVCSEHSQTYKAAQRHGCFAVSKRFGLSNDFVYDISSSGEATLIRYDGSAQDIVIPHEFEGCPVTTIGYNTFPLNTRSIVFPNSVTTILGNCPCPKLRQVKMSRNISFIGANTFSEAQFQKPVSIAASCSSIGANSFSKAILVFEGHSVQVSMREKALTRCFSKGEPPIDFAKYDSFLLHRPMYAGKLHAILLRIAYPYELAPKTRKCFMDYLFLHKEEVIEQLVSCNDLAILTALTNEEFFLPSHIDDCLTRFHKASFTQGIVHMIEYRHHHSSSHATRFTL